MKINKDNKANNSSESQSKRDFQRSQKPKQTPPLFTNLKSKIISSSSVDMHNNKMKGISNPRLDEDPINFRYLKENYVPKTSISNRTKSSTRFLPKSGGTMSGDINMGGNQVIEIQTLGVNPSMDKAATVGYVRERTNKVSVDPNVIEKIKELSELSKELEVIEEVLGIKPIFPDTPPRGRRRRTRNFYVCPA